MFCVYRVVVQADKTMKFFVYWQAHHFEYMTKESDANNTGIYLTDNLGNQYAFTEAGAAAVTPEQFGRDKPVYGWYLFPAAKDGATIFSIHDDCINVSIDSGGYSIREPCWFKNSPMIVSDIRLIQQVYGE